MTLLAFDHVTVRMRRGGRDIVALDDVSFEMEAGEWVGIWGQPHTGRTTLLRVAGGILTPSEGQVRFDGRGIARGRTADVARELPYCDGHVGKAHETPLVTELAIVSPGLGVRRRRAARAELTALRERCGALHCVGRPLKELEPAERVRLAIAYALFGRPRVLLLDEPTYEIYGARERDRVLGLLRSIADDGVAILMTTDNAASLAGTDRALAIGNGALRGRLMPNSAQVIPLP